MTIDLGGGPLGPFGWNEATWVAVGSAASMIVALATLGLAISTRLLASETKTLVTSGNEERQQVERHHQQGLTPLVVIDADCIPEGQRVRFVGKIRNVGPGPATGVFFGVKPDLAAPSQRYGRALAAGEVWDLDLSWNAGQEVSGLSLLPYRCLLTFSSIFVTEGVVEQYSPTGKRLDLSIRTMVLPERSRPGEAAQMRDAFMGPLPVQFAEGEMGPR